MLSVVRQNPPPAATTRFPQQTSFPNLQTASRRTLYTCSLQICCKALGQSRKSLNQYQLHHCQHRHVLHTAHNTAPTSRTRGSPTTAGSLTASALKGQQVGLPARDEDEAESNEWDMLTPDEVDDRVEAAAAFIGVIDELRPLNPKQFNAAFEIWKVIKRIPPAARPKLLNELDAGAIRGLWRHSMSRYVLDDERALQMFGDFSVLDDFPQEPGQVYTYLGRCEQFVLNDATIGVDQAKQSRYPRSQPWLKPSPGSVEIPQNDFTSYFFTHPTNGEVYCRTVLRWFANLDRWWVPIYARVNIELVLTPMQSDAGADMTLVYPLEDLRATSEFTDAAGTSYGDGVWSLQGRDLPHKGWPAPRPEVWSPFSRSGVDYVRVVGPGVYVGCAYRPEVPGMFRSEDNLYFLLVRRP